MQSKMLVALLLILAIPVAVAETPGMTRGKATLRSASALAFGPDDVLFVGDSVGAAVYAIDVADKGRGTGTEPLRVADIDAKVAAVLGIPTHDLMVNDMAVHPTSEAVYLAVSRGRGDGALPAVVRVRSDGTVENVSLDSVAHAKASLDRAPAPDAKDRRGNSLRTLTITDMAFADGEVYVAGLSNEEFASSLRRIPYPFAKGASFSSLEIYHGNHGTYETHAPIRTFLPYESEGEAHLLAAYTCTPLVDFPVDTLRKSEHVKGTTIAELGFGNHPLDMVTVGDGDDRQLIIANSSRAGMRIRMSDLKGAKGISEPVRTATAGVSYDAMPLGGTVRMAHLNDAQLLLLQRDVVSGSLNLRSIPKARLGG